MNSEAGRRSLTSAQRVVIKVGTNLLVQRDGRPNRRRLASLTAQIAAQHAAGRELILVSSGAIGAGVAALGLRSRPNTLPELQVAAAVGQTRLMTRYAELFASHGLDVGQVLLTHADLRERVRHINARNTLLALLRHRLLPIVNENDVVAVDEIKFGDNDHLASLVAMLLEADALLLLSTVNGLREPREDGKTRRVPFLSKVNKRALGMTWEQSGGLSTGGMSSKLQAAAQAAEVGTSVVIANGRDPGIIARVLGGEDVGTYIAPRQRSRGVPSKKRWIAYFHRPEGSLLVDEGAAKALRGLGRSLLPAGIRSVEGSFGLGALVTVQSCSGELVGRGLVDYDSAQIGLIKGCRSGQIAGILGRKDYDQVIHRDNLVVFPKESP